MAIRIARPAPPWGGIAGNLRDHGGDHLDLGVGRALVSVEYTNIEPVVKSLVRTRVRRHLRPISGHGRGRLRQRLRAWRSLLAGWVLRDRFRLFHRPKIRLLGLGQNTKIAPASDDEAGPSRAISDPSGRSRRRGPGGGPATFPTAPLPPAWYARSSISDGRYSRDEAHVRRASDRLRALRPTLGRHLHCRR